MRKSIVLGAPKHFILSIHEANTIPDSSAIMFVRKSSLQMLHYSEYYIQRILIWAQVIMISQKPLRRCIQRTRSRNIYSKRGGLQSIRIKTYNRYRKILEVSNTATQFVSFAHNSMESSIHPTLPYKFIYCYMYVLITDSFIYIYIMEFYSRWKATDCWPEFLCLLVWHSWNTVLVSGCTGYYVDGKSW